MNGFDLLGRTLKVQWANSPHLPGAGGAPAGAGPPVGAPGASGVGLGYRCTVLENMVTAAEAGDPELEGEIKEECGKYGQIEAVKVRAEAESK
jgi:hypothetical protein